MKRWIIVAMIAVAAFTGATAGASETPDVLIKVGGGYSSAELKGNGLRVWGSRLDPESDCLVVQGGNPDEKLPDLGRLIESGPAYGIGDTDVVEEDGEKFVKLAAFTGLPVLSIVNKSGTMLINGKPSGYSHLLVDAGDMIVSLAGKKFRGSIELLAQARGGLLIVNRIPMEDYLKGMMDAEMSHSWPPQALKAQAVASRTYATYQRYFGGKCHYHMESSVLSQVYNGLAREREQIRKVVDETRGEVLTAGGEPVMALFHSCCGGTTRDNAEVFGKPSPCLKPAKCGFDQSCPLNRWKRSMTLARLSEVLGKAGLYEGAVRSASSNGGGQVVIDGTGGKATLKGDAVRVAAGYTVIPSGRFTVAMEGSGVVISGMGAGHGVGMCQYGAKGMAQAGWDYKKILTHYFKGSEIVRMY
ncbi:MAG: SpoIID/LytB domain-containing protein [Myxococcota bacterium]|jgi:stage II sporulation protein D